MYLGTNPSALRSQSELAQAMLSLMDMYIIDEITITMICQEAALSRQTFYQIFDDKDDVVRYLIIDSYHEFETELKCYKRLTIQQLAEYTYLFFDRNRDFVMLLLKNKLNYLLLEQFQAMLPKVLSLLNNDDAVSDQAILSFLAGGLCSMILYQIEFQDREQAHRSAIEFSKLFRETYLSANA